MVLVQLTTGSGRDIWLNFDHVESMQVDDKRPLTLIWMADAAEELERYEVRETPEEIVRRIAAGPGCTR